MPFSLKYFSHIYLDLLLRLYFPPLGPLPQMTLVMIVLDRPLPQDRVGAAGTLRSSPHYARLAARWRTLAHAMTSLPSMALPSKGQGSISHSSDSLAPIFYKIDYITAVSIYFTAVEMKAKNRCGVQILFRYCPRPEYLVSWHTHEAEVETRAATKAFLGCVKGTE